MTNDKTSGVSGFIKGLKTEFNKIIFPEKQDVIKQTVATIVVSVFIGLVIAGLDLVMKTGLGFILK